MTTGQSDIPFLIQRTNKPLGRFVRKIYAKESGAVVARYKYEHSISPSSGDKKDIHYYSLVDIKEM